jgi:hypothetical protein
MPNLGEKKEFNWTKIEKTQLNQLKPNKTQKKPKKPPPGWV